MIYTGDYIRPKLAQEIRDIMLAQMDSMIYYDTVSEFFLGIPIGRAFEDAIAEARILRTLKDEVNYV